jgi:hypothetical protein
MSRSFFGPIHRLNSVMARFNIFLFAPSSKNPVSFFATKKEKQL